LASTWASEGPTLPVFAAGWARIAPDYHQANTSPVIRHFCDVGNLSHDEWQLEVLFFLLLAGNVGVVIARLRSFKFEVWK
jgi:hypothetical protein